MKFGYTIIYVDDVEEVLAFYQRAFNIQTRYINDSKHYGELETGETTLAFASDLMAENVLPIGHMNAFVDEHPYGYDIGFITENVDRAFERATAAGAKEVAPPKLRSWGQTVAYVRSIEGTLVGLYSPVTR